VCSPHKPPGAPPWPPSPSSVVAVGACGSSSDDDVYVLGQPRYVHGHVVGFDGNVRHPHHHPIRRTTPHSSPSPRPRPTTVRASVPAILVGTWSGGSEGETAGTSYTFASDGRFLIRRPGGSITGVAVARSGTITFYFSGKSVTSSYSVTELPEVYGGTSRSTWRSAATATCARSDQSITI
jgi:hypothetical protein